MKFLFLILIWILVILMPTFVYAQEMNHQDELKKVIGDEDVSEFFSNQNSGDFQKIFWAESMCTIYRGGAISKDP